MVKGVDLELLLSGLTGAQHHAVVTDSAPLCVLAGAGAGKTRVLTRRIAYRIATGRAEAGRVLALTFTRKAAGELGDRLRALGVRDRLTAGTFHGVAYGQLRQYWADRGEPAPALLDRKARLLGRLVGGRPHVTTAPLRDLAAEIEWAQARLITPDRYPEAAAAAGRRLPVPAGALAALYARYETEKQRRGLADFDDLLARCAAALERDPGFAAIARWRWRHLFVDEFQDVNPLQHRLLSAWLGDRTDLCVVGDPNQAIYGWNGADPELLSGLVVRWPQAEVVRLDDNHRCTPQVVAAAAAVLGHAGDALRSARADGPRPAVRSYPTDRDEAGAVAAEIRQARTRGVGWSEMAVLARINAQLTAFESAFRAAEVPYRVAGSRLLLDDPDIQAELAALAALAARDSRPFAMVVADLAASGRAGDHDGDGAGGQVSGGRRAAQVALASMARDFQALDPRPTIAGFLAWLSPATSRDRTDEPGDLVTICTFHRAKGLEWQAVWVTGLEDGLVPMSHATTPEAEQEERRLLYVALTRAGSELRCSWAQQRTLGERLVPRRPSRWLQSISATAAGSDDRRRRRRHPVPGTVGRPARPAGELPAARHVAPAPRKTRARSRDRGCAAPVAGGRGACGGCTGACAVPRRHPGRDCCSPARQHRGAARRCGPRPAQGGPLRLHAARRPRPSPGQRLKGSAPAGSMTRCGSRWSNT